MRVARSCGVRLFVTIYPLSRRNWAGKGDRGSDSSRA